MFDISYRFVRITLSLTIVIIGFTDDITSQFFRLILMLSLFSCIGSILYLEKKDNHKQIEKVNQ